MLSVTSLSGFGGSGAFGPTLLQAIQAAGLTSNLVLCLDAGDGASYLSGTKWLDVSGNGYDFNFGDGSTSTTYPAFTGSVGSRSAYWLFDGGDYFTYDSPNETWMQNLHKNNASFSFISGYFLPQAGGDFALFGTLGTGALGPDYGNIGIVFGPDARGIASDVTEIAVGKGTGSSAGGANAAYPTTNAWYIDGVSLNEATGAGGGFLYRNGGYLQVGGADTWDATYSSPSASNATNTAQIGSAGGGTNPAHSGCRLSFLAAWSTALTKGNFDTLHASLRGRLNL